MLSTMHDPHAYPTVYPVQHSPARSPHTPSRNSRREETLASFHHLVAESDIVLGIGLRQCCILLLPLLGVPDAKAAAEDLADGFERHALAFRVAEHDENPTDSADAGVEAKGTRRSHALHHRKESGSNDDIGAPASDGVEHGAESADLMGNKFSADPSDCGNTRREEGDVADDADEDKDGGPASDIAFESKCLSVDRDVVEGDGGDEHADGHAENSHLENSAAAESVDEN